jgi:hypothetical protein
MLAEDAVAKDDLQCIKGLAASSIGNGATMTKNQES